MKKIIKKDLFCAKWINEKTVKSVGIRFIGLVMLIAGIPCRAQTSESYTPPLPLDSIDALIERPSENGYGLGALIAANKDYQHSPSSASPPIENEKAPQTAVAREARKAAAARREVKSLTRQLALLQAQQQKLADELAAADARAKTAEEKAMQPTDPLLLTQLQEQLTTAKGELLLQDKVQIALRNQLALLGENEKQLTASKTTLQAREIEMFDQAKQLKTAKDKLSKVEQQLASAQSKIETFKVQSSGAVAALNNAEGIKAYVVGQSIASSLRERLESYATTGETLSRDGVLAGIGDGLAGKMQLPRNEMDKVYREFTASLQKNVASKVKAAEQQLARAIKGKKVAKTVDGIHYVVIKKGKAITDPDAPVSLSLTEQKVDGAQTISQVPRLTLSVEDDMPSVVREALPLLGVGSEVKAWAMARTVYGNLPLPKGVEPYTVLSYDMKGLATGPRK